ncbi:MAG: hypothetical protein ABS39_11750 [Acidovorax sp. SCN 65-28]|jgi:general secretion pathway protein H|uniref:pilus assembly FimT family protein n=1 Tax=Acidovorax sp. TaxID=1872122 RepID=UPI00086AD493|nr:GspH/FimT family pseudopilin [Acidovorax sp.]MBN9625535.1 GspH/FimT family pseudopilin [Acidovorax sp.]ODS76872.1 MAG: hypothetical protein ABS39_11750 [Acidovorax sp. SCN 65-28]
MLRAKGFTLLELMVVLAISALLIGMAPMAYSRLKEAMDYRSTIRTLRADLREARMLARVQGAEVRFNVDVERRAFRIEGRPWQAIPEPLGLRLTIGGIDWNAARVGAIRFLPDGGATGGSIDLMRPSGDGTRLQIDWLSGRIALVALAER